MKQNAPERLDEYVGVVIGCDKIEFCITKLVPFAKHSIIELFPIVAVAFIKIISFENTPTVL